MTRRRLAQYRRRLTQRRYNHQAELARIRGWLLSHGAPVASDHHHTAR
jgi:hypothetical protein